MKRIIINHPGDGEWIMEYLGGRFFPGHDHSLANHDAVSGDLLGGFCFPCHWGGQGREANQNGHCQHGNDNQGKEVGTGHISHPP